MKFLLTVDLIQNNLKMKQKWLFEDYLKTFIVFQIQCSQFELCLNSLALQNQQNTASTISKRFPRRFLPSLSKKSYFMYWRKKEAGRQDINENKNTSRVIFEIYEENEENSYIVR
jgi:hypothetical protein